MVYDRAATARHEAGHVAALIMSARVPASVSIDWPETEALGLTSLDFNHDGVNPDSAPVFIRAILLGPLSAGKAGWPPEWPLDRDATDCDTRQLAILANYLELDEGGWYSLVRQARFVARSDTFKRLVSLIASALEKVDEMDGEQIKFLLGPATCLAWGIPPLQEEHHALA